MTATRELKPREAKLAPAKPAEAKYKNEAKILHQAFFKSVGPRTYAAQVKELANGNQMLVLTEGRRDESSGEVRKTRIFVFAEDFPAFFGLVKQSEDFIKAHPLPPEVQARRRRVWEAKANGKPAAAEGKTAGKERWNGAGSRAAVPASFAAVAR